MAFAAEQLGRLGTTEERRATDENNIKTKLRTLGRLCQQIRERSKTTFDFNEYIQPKYFKMIVQATKDLAIKSPQLGLTIGHYLRNLVLLKITEAIEKGAAKERSAGDDFKQMMESRWSTQVSSVTLRRQKLKQLNKQQHLPVTDDLVKLAAFIKSSIELEKDLTMLAKLCLSQLLLFNKRRPMEVAELKKEDFRLISNVQAPNQEVLNSLGYAERLLAKRYV